MKKTVGRISFTAGALLLLGLVGATIAWACAPGGYLEPPTPESVSPGQAITVRGHDFSTRGGPAGPQPVEIHLDSADGPSLGTTSGPSFTEVVTIPAGTSPGYHYIVADLHCECGGVPEDGREVINVAAAQQSPTGGSPPTVGGGQGSDAVNGDSSPADAVAPASGEATGTAPETGDTVAFSDPPLLREGLVRGDDGVNAVRRDGQGKRSSGGRERGGSAQLLPTGIADGALAIGKRSGQAAFSGSLKNSDGGISRRREASRSKAGQETGGPPDRSIPRPDGLPSLTSPIGSTTPDDGPDSRLGIGMALLGLGIVLPLAGFLIAETRRRRAHTEARQPR